MASPEAAPALTEAYLQMFQYFQGLSQGAALGPAAMGMRPFAGGLPLPYSPGAPPMSPAVNVFVEGMQFQYQLTEDDLQKVFSRYGAVKSIAVDEGGASASVLFGSFPEAQAAMTDLNGKVLNGLEGTLRITWAMAPAAPYAGVPGMPYAPPWAGFPPFGGAPGWPLASHQDQMPISVPHVAAMAQSHPSSPERLPHVRGTRKYMCRFMIGIGNEKEFQVARRIIGAKGANMKRIVRETEAKLRLRGLGSGYFEGASQKESSEPLQLCVSCVSSEGYQIAVRGVEELLTRVYDEYKHWCRETGRPVPDLGINMSENQLVYSSRAQDSSSGLPDSPEVSARESKERRMKSSKTTRDAVPDSADRGEPGANSPSPQEIEKMIDERNEARRSNQFMTADRIREDLHSRGVALMDEPGGRGRGLEVTTWRYWRE